jgi:putative tricarboxylic transport membrane protein
MLLSARENASAEGDQAPQNNDGVLYISGLFAIALLYQQSIRWFGYVLPTALVAPIVLYIFGVRSWTGLAVSVVVCPLIYHIIFFELLGVFPPFGVVFELLTVIGG